MQPVTEEQIRAMAVNAAALANARKISQKGGFLRLERSEDDTFYMGECSGSGKSNYITSADFIEPGNIVCRCSCPSRQFPCKHGLALLFEISAGKNFEICEIPEDIQKKREKKLARNQKAGKQAEGELSPEMAEKKKASAAKSAKAAKTKKIKKQMEGLSLTETLVRDLVRAGLGTMGGTALKTYEQLAKQLGDYYLPGPQRLLNGLILEIAAFQRDQREEHYENAIDILKKLWTLVKKSRQYLEKKLAENDVDQDDNRLYEELGGIWKLTELEAIGRGKTNLSLMQLSFWVAYDMAGKEYIDTGCWADLSTGEIFMTYNYRPVKALKYIKEEDTVFHVAQVAKAFTYPGEGNLRIRWDQAQIRQTELSDLQKLRSLAVKELAPEVKNVKNRLKNALADPMLLKLISFERIGIAGEDYFLETLSGETIVLGDVPGMEATAERIGLLPDSSLLKGQTLLGAFYYDKKTARIKLQPLSIVTEETVVRLLY